MRITRESILSYLRKIKPEYEKKGIEITALFGSFSKGNETVYSDIDIAIKKNDLFFQTYSAYDYFGIVADIKENISRQLHRNTDIYDLDSKSGFTKKIREEMIHV